MMKAKVKCKSCGQVLDSFNAGYVGLREHLLTRHQTRVEDWFCLREYFKGI